jgi:hypothetical protein
MSDIRPPEAIVEEVTTAVRDAVIAARAALGGLKTAVPDVARRYGLSERRVRSYWWSQVTFVSAFERQTILAAQKRDLSLRLLRQSHAIAMTQAALAQHRNTNAGKEQRPVRGVVGGGVAGYLDGLAQTFTGADPARGPAQGSLNLGLSFGRR